MRKELTRTKQALSNESIQRIIDTTAYGVLSLNGDDGYLYTVPLSYVYTGGAVYFHGSPRGYKSECFREPTKQAFRSSGKVKSFRLSERIIFKAFSSGEGFTSSPTLQKNSPLCVHLLKSTAAAFPIMKRKFSIP